MVVAIDTSILSEEEILDGAERSMFGTDNVGFCVKCGAESTDCEPDAREYRCEACGSYSVYGAQELLNYIS